MPSVGETVTKFGRQFTFVNPNDTLGPGNWRLSSLDEINSTSGGGGGINDVEGVNPVVSTLVTAGEVDISIDISSLTEKP